MDAHPQGVGLALKVGRDRGPLLEERLHVVDVDAAQRDLPGAGRCRPAPATCPLRPERMALRCACRLPSIKLPCQD